LLALLIDRFGWRESLWILAVVVGPILALISLFFVRDRPQVCELNADGDEASSGSAIESAARVVNRTLADARRDPVFWLYSGSLSIHALFGTAVTFHIVAIFAEAGRGRDEAFAYFLPQAIISVATNLLASTLTDYTRLKPFLVVMLVSFILGAAGLLWLENSFGYWGLAIGFGIGGGLWSTISNLCFVRHFGPLHLGEISGLNAALTVFASAIGPLLFSLAFDWTGSFAGGPIICLVALMGLLLASLVLRQPHDQVP